MAFFKNLFKNKDEKKGGAPAPAHEGGAPAPAKVTRDDFEDIEVLGKGSFAKVVLVRKKATNEYYAMKVIDKKTVLEHKRHRDAFIERDVMKRLPHPYLLRLYNTFQSEHKLFFVVDYMPGGDLDKYLNSLPNKALDYRTTQLYAMQVFLALRYLHENGVIYRDLKPENILMSREGHCILADFGLSKDFGGEVDSMVAASFVGSPFYVAPDVLKQRPYTEAIDYWSFGVLLFRMLYGRPPFSGRTMKEVFDAIVTKEVHFPTSYIVPGDEQARDLILRLLTKDPLHRINAEGVANHPYWTGLDPQKVMAREVLPANWKPLPTAEEHAETVVHAYAAGTADPKATAGVSATEVTHTAPGAAAPLPAHQQAAFDKFSTAT